MMMMMMMMMMIYIFSEEEDGAGYLPRDGERDPGLRRQDRRAAGLQPQEQT